jgi:hypothetical protein
MRFFLSVSHEGAPVSMPASLCAIAELFSARARAICFFRMLWR